MFKTFLVKKNIRMCADIHQRSKKEKNIFSKGTDGKMANLAGFSRVQ